MSNAQDVLNALASSPPVSVWQLAPLAGVNVSTCQALLDQLHEAGLAEHDANHLWSVTESYAAMERESLVASMGDVLEEERQSIVASFGTRRWSEALPDDAFCRPGCSHEHAALTASAAPALRSRRLRLQALIDGDT